jgi:hypothetical protein
MTSFVEECRREWKRLGVPDLLADEMATELESDLADAEADGVSAAELLGESDPRRFAATWARERGLVSEPAPQKRRRRSWPWIIVALVLVFLSLSWLALQTLGSTHASSAPPVQVHPVRPIHAVRVPRLVGLKPCRAERIARRQGLKIREIPKSRCSAVVIEQHPRPGAVVPRHAPVTLLARLG